jgi:hypothetical protein
MTMIEQLADAARPVLEWSAIRRTRRNHGLEHGTITVLSGQVRGVPMAGRSDDSGFVIFGDVTTVQVESAAREALHRMRNGEHHLAVHPGCGTNLLTAGALTSLAGIVGFSGTNRKSALDRLPMMMGLMMIAVLVSQPLGMSLQRHFTTEGDPGDLEIVSVTRRDVRGLFGRKMTLHRVNTQGG